MLPSKICWAKSIDVDLAALLSSQDTDSNSIGYVHSVFKRVINLILYKQERLFSIGNSEVPLAPYTIRTTEAEDFRSLLKLTNPTIPIYLVNKKLVIDRKMKINMENAEIWDSTISRISPLSTDSFLSTLQEITHLIEMAGREGGFKTIWLSYMKDDHHHQKGLHERELSRRFTYLHSLLETRKWQQAYEAAKGLVGLGQGLTPSGDDFLAGWILTLLAFNHPMGTVFTDNKADWLPFLKGRTTIVSYFMLEAAIYGKGNEAIKNLLSHIHLNHMSIRPDIKNVLSIGSCSGTDMLAGVGFALNMVMGMQRRQIGSGL